MPGKFKIGDRVDLHFFGSDRGELCWVEKLNEKGEPKEFRDKNGTRIKAEEVVCYFAR